MVSVSFFKKEIKKRNMCRKIDYTESSRTNFEGSESQSSEGNDFKNLENNHSSSSSASHRNETLTSSSQLPVETTESASSKKKKTILMGVFKAGNENGIKGTSMRKHNVAT